MLNVECFILITLPVLSLFPKDDGQWFPHLFLLLPRGNSQARDGVKPARPEREYRRRKRACGLAAARGLLRRAREIARRAFPRPSLPNRSRTPVSSSAADATRRSTSRRSGSDFPRLEPAARVREISKHLRR